MESREKKGSKIGSKIGILEKEAFSNFSCIEISCEAFCYVHNEFKFYEFINNKDNGCLFLLVFINPI